MRKAFTRAGYKVRCYGGKGTLSFGMYPGGFGSLVEGFSKGFVSGARAISVASLILTVCWVTGGVSLTRHLAHAIIMRPAGDIIGDPGDDIPFAFISKITQVELKDF